MFCIVKNMRAFTFFLKMFRIFGLPDVLPKGIYPLDYQPGNRYRILLSSIR
jgi:hypothetical protein